jgi:hypothetical protein
VYKGEDAANARTGNSEQNRAQVHVFTEQNQVGSKPVKVVQDFESWIVGQQWCQVDFSTTANKPDTFSTA